MHADSHRELGAVETGTGSPRVAAAFSASARVTRMLEVEAALARAQAGAGLIPVAAAEAIADACRTERFDAEAITSAAIRYGSPVIPLVERLREVVDAAHAGFVHAGATTQDIVDTALVLQVRDALAILDDELLAVGSRCADLAIEHRATPMAGRTLLQQAAPISFGAKVAHWLSALTRRVERMRALRPAVLVVQLGGATGTLAAMRGHGEEVVAAVAQKLGLAVPDLPWHTDRDRIVDLVGDLAGVAGVVGKIATDIILLAQSEVAEVAEGEPGGSSALPQKRNPVQAVTARAAAQLAVGEASSLLAATAHEHERAAGAWQAEWVALPSLFVRCGGAVERLHDALDDLRVDADRMRTNLDASGGLVMAEPLATALAEHLGPGPARDLVTRLCGDAVEQARPLREVAMADETVSAHLDESGLAEAFDPATALGSSGDFIDSAVATFERLGKARKDSTG